MLRAAVLGSPIAHSLSPLLHRAAYEVLGLSWEYTAVECDEIQFPAFFAGLDNEWMGLSLTMPLKEVVFDVVEVVDELTTLVGSANTLFRQDATPGNPWHATNTDILGMVRALRERGLGEIESGTILGAGATARSALAALAALGASRIDVHARRPEARDEMTRLGSRLGINVSAGDLEPVVVGSDVLVSTLPSDIGSSWLEAPIDGSTALLDVSYHPWPTPLAARWHEEFPGRIVASGRDMLVWQAVAQVAWMTGAFDPGLEDDDSLPAQIVAAMRRSVSE